MTITAPKLDWQRIMRDLSLKGCSGYRVGTILGVADSTVRNWLKGGEPGYGYGCALLALHTEYCGDDLTKRRVTEADELA